jgi:Cof subfamily protein (haloacid dehalogenase superfamily)
MVRLGGFIRSPSRSPDLLFDSENRGALYHEAKLIKLLAIDLDGTLYNSAHKLTARGREAVWKAREAGLQPVIVTGRGRRGAENALDALGLELPYICSAGSLVRLGPTGDPIYAWTFQAAEELFPLFQFTRENQTGLIADTLEGRPYWFGPDSLSEVMDPLTAKEAFKSIRSFAPEADFDRPLLKMTIAAEPGLLQQAEQVVRENCPSVHQTYSGPNYIDLTPEGVNKGMALKALADYWGLQSSEIAAIGDQCIDFQMLQYAGLSIAMSNGVQELKEIARWVAPSNDEDGVAWAVDEILKQGVSDVV